MLYEEVGYYPRPEWLKFGTHFVFEEGIVAWTETSWRLMTRRGKEFEEPLPPMPRHYGPVYENLLRAVRNEGYRPETWEYAADVAIAQAAYASSSAGHEIDLTNTEWSIARQNVLLQSELDKAS